MPKRTKKLLVYLDQNFISELAKSDINSNVKNEWKELYQLLKEGFLEEKLVVPQSWFHDVETSLAPVLKERIVSYQNYLGQVRLHNAEHVKTYQMSRFLRRFLGEADEDPLAPELAFRDHPDGRVKQFNITVDLNLSQWQFDSQRSQTAAELDDIRNKCISDKVKYEDQLKGELRASRQYVLQKAFVFQHVCRDPARDLVAFVKDPAFSSIPVVSISSRLWSRVLTKFPTRKIKTGDATDIDVLSTYLPYMDVIGTDAFMATQLDVLGIDDEHNVQVFSAKTKSLQNFCFFLRDYLKNALPSNRPSISVFVLPSPSVKENAFRLFFDLGAAAREFGENEYAKIYGFDDGRMPRYELRQYGGIELPFYGLQEVDTIDLKARATTEETVNICREHCRSNHFVIIDEYRPVKKLFLVGAAMQAEAGVQTAEGWRIYTKK